MKSNFIYYEERCVFLLIIVFLTFRVLDAPIRYYLMKLSLTPITLVPNILIICFLTISLLKLILTLQVDRKILLIALFFVYAAIIGVIFIGNFKQITYAFYVLLPLFWGMRSSRTFTDNFFKIKHLITILWALSVLGVFLSVYYQFPWTDMTYDRFGTEVEGSREWAIQGFSRYAGFSRVSFEAASVIMILCLMLIVWHNNIVIKLIIWILSGFAIALTTTKGMIGTYLIVIFSLFIWNWRKLRVALTVAIVLFVTILPLSTKFITYNLGINDFILRIIFLSFEDRLLNTWPEALLLLEKHGSFLLGRGMGGIGGPQTIFEPIIKNPADNLFLYLFVIFGFSAFIIIYHILQKTIALINSDNNALNSFYFLFWLTVFTFGLTANTIEAPLFGFLIGTALLYKPNQQYDPVTINA